MSKKEPLVIYWAVSSLEGENHRVLLADISFNSVMKDISHRRAKNPKTPKSDKFVPEGSYHLCTALHELADNMFYLDAPFDIDIELNSEGNILPSKRSNWFLERGQTMENAFNIDFNYEIHIFSEETVDISVTPPYLHKSSIPSYGFVSAVKWRLSCWFRPVVVIFQLWPGVRELHIKKGEPLIYMSFDTERPIVFKQFRQTPTITHISSACLRHKYMFQFLPLRVMYDKFVRQGLRNDLLKEIKANIVGETIIKNKG
jgi:hypothetical protein